MSKHLTGKQLVWKVVNIKSDDSMYDGEWGVQVSVRANPDRP